jgi:hypothetical protein
MNMTNIATNEGASVKSAVDHDQTEARWAERDFASEIKGKDAQQHASRAGKDYEVRPCKSVRGHILRLPVTGWVFWFPTAAEAAGFAKRLAAIHPADCCVFDASGHLISRMNLVEPSSPTSAK